MFVCRTFTFSSLHYPLLPPLPYHLSIHLYLLISPPLASSLHLYLLISPPLPVFPLLSPLLTPCYYTCSSACYVTRRVSAVSRRTRLAVSRAPPASSCTRSGTSVWPAAPPPSLTHAVYVTPRVSRHREGVLGKAGCDRKTQEERVGVTEKVGHWNNLKPFLAFFRLLSLK